jgi:hypothetical protein
MTGVSNAPAYYAPPHHEIRSMARDMDREVVKRSSLRGAMASSEMMSSDRCEMASSKMMMKGAASAKKSKPGMMSSLFSWASKKAEPKEEIVRSSKMMESKAPARKMMMKKASPRDEGLMMMESCSGSVGMGAVGCGAVGNSMAMAMGSNECDEMAMRLAALNDLDFKAPVKEAASKSNDVFHDEIVK